MFCVSWLLIEWPQKEGCLFSVTGFLVLRVRTRYKKRQHWWWELKSSNDSLRTQFFLFFLFCSSHVYTVLHIFLYVHVAPWNLQGFDVQVPRICKDSASSVPFEFPRIGIWVTSPRLFHRDKIIWIAEGDKSVIKCAWEEGRLHLCTE